MKLAEVLAAESRDVVAHHGFDDALDALRVLDEVAIHSDQFRQMSKPLAVLREFVYERGTHEEHVARRAPR